MKKIVAAATFFAVVSWGLPHSAQAYPTDTVSQERTKIRRLRWQQDINEGSYRGRKIPPGAQWSTDRVKLRMLDQGQDFDLTLETPKDPQLQAGLEAIMQKWRFKRYNIALLDITDPSRPRYAAINEQEKQTPGSVAKVLLGAGFLQQLKERFPNDVSKREALMRDVTVKADDWAMPNHHEVPVIIGDVYSGKYRTSIRRVLNGDTFSLWEWMDHALSPSSNASATMLWRETTLMKLLGEAYPPENYDADLWKRWDRTTTTEAAYDVVEKPLRDAGLNVDDFYVRMFFTRNASRYVKAEASRASPFGILRWMIKVEQGKMVDRFSSLELKRMIYLTRRRIRYAHTKALDDSAVYFKTGSLYSCVEEIGFQCGKYRGNAVNVLNSLVEVETPAPPPPQASVETAANMSLASSSTEPASTAEVAPTPPPIAHVYLVAVMSNELRRNAASDHATLGTAIHEMITQTPEPTPTPEKIP